MAVPPLAVAIMLEEMADIIAGLSPQGGFDEELSKARDFARQMRGLKQVPYVMVLAGDGSYRRQRVEPCSDQES